ncbi:fluoride efflux transporter CrcB [Qipengyuania sp. YIM B01966]|uniref:fluoride efflux transporter CrcB n=1 Tax=Qipengyuania sp. YIM B01966 TaxID=2778646 RepID=UPI0018F5EC9D|nr:fluoride efflux transporter CrcB [Qipengyuania sp. YIM B01966]
MHAAHPLAASLQVALGGALGAVLRYQTGGAVARWLGPSAAAAFPWATLAVNVTGSFAMGLLAGWLARHDGAEGWWLLLGVGLLGGFTTFSAFSLELLSLIERGAPGLALAYALVSVAAGLAGLWLGVSAMRGLA